MFVADHERVHHDEIMENPCSRGHAVCRVSSTSHRQYADERLCRRERLQKPDAQESASHVQFQSKIFECEHDMDTVGFTRIQQVRWVIVGVGGNTQSGSVCADL